MEGAYNEEKGFLDDLHWFDAELSELQSVREMAYPPFRPRHTHTPPLPFPPP